MIPRMWALLALCGVLVALVGGVYTAGYSAGGTAKQSAYDATLRAEEQRNAALERLLLQKVERVAEDAANEQRILLERLTAAGLSNDRLRDAIRSADSNTDTSTSSGFDAVTARALLANCAGKYRDMARTADELRANVLGLQAYVRGVIGD